VEAARLRSPSLIAKTMVPVVSSSKSTSMVSVVIVDHVEKVVTEQPFLSCLEEAQPAHRPSYAVGSSSMEGQVVGGSPSAALGDSTSSLSPPGSGKHLSMVQHLGAGGPCDNSALPRFRAGGCCGWRDGRGGHRDAGSRRRCAGISCCPGGSSPPLSPQGACLHLKSILQVDAREGPAATPPSFGPRLVAADVYARFYSCR
jgi:hypothetical protein